MTKEEILTYLCEYDRRNPDCTEDEKYLQERLERLKKSEDSRCGCHNCYYGRTKLAEELLKHVK